MKFFTIDKKTTLSGDINHLWEVLALEFGNISNYSKNLIYSKYLDEKREGEGTTRFCRFNRKDFLVEEITIWYPKERLGFKITDTSLPISHGSSLEFRMVELTDGKISIDINGKYRFKVLGFLSPFFSFIIKNMIEGYLSDIKRALK